MKLSKPFGKLQAKASGREDKLFVSPAIHTSVHSTYNASVSCTYSSLSPEFKVVAVEDARRETMVRISEAVSQKCNAAKWCLIVADAILHRFDGTNDGSEMINELKDEVRQLQKLVGNKQSFETAGYTFGVASALSHNLQRFAYRGEANEKIIKFPAYVTPIANLFAQQAREFDSNEKFRVPKIEQDIEKLLAPNQTRTGVVNNHQDGVSSGKGSVVSTANKSDYEKVTTFLKKVYAKGWKRKKDKNSNKAVISMALLLLWLLCVMQGKHEEKSEYFESITKCLKALTNLASAIQVLLPGEETIWSLVIEYFI